MILNSRAIALLLGASTATVTTAFLSLVTNDQTSLVVTAILSFASCYLLSNIVLEFLFFKEINSVYEALKKIRGKDFSFAMEERRKANLNPLRKINQEIRSYAAIKQREINELKKMETFRREFLADVSHELKTPIFAAQGFVHTLLDGAVEDKSIRNKFLKKAAKSLDGLNMLVHDLLTLSHMEAGEIRMHYENFNIAELTKEVFDQFESKAEKKKLELKFNSPKERVMVYADYQRIYQVMLNLISNAIKYTDENGKVIVEFEDGRNDVTIFVKDNGHGIPTEDLKRIFERFYRVDKSRSKEKGGSGLGLAIVKHIIEAHNSNVNVTSSLGKGSTFSFKLRKGKEINEKVLERVEEL